MRPLLIRFSQPCVQPNTSKMDKPRKSKNLLVVAGVEHDAGWLKISEKVGHRGDDTISWLC